MTDNIGGKYRNYDYGYIPRDDKVPEGWVRTLRPCMGCSSSVTYIDNDKVWHCMKCGWSCSVNDTHVLASIENTADSGKENKDSEIREEEENGMALPYSDHDFEMVKKGLEQGKTVSAISASIGRGTDALNHKIKAWREDGRLPESKRGKVAPDTANTDEPHPLIWDRERESLVLDAGNPVVEGGISNISTIQKNEGEDWKGGDFIFLDEKTGKYTNVPPAVESVAIPPVDFPEFTAEYVKELQVKLKEANLKLENEEANYEALELHVKGLEEQSKFYLKESQDYLSKLKEVNDLAYQFEEQALDLQIQLKSQHDYIHALEEVAAKTIPSRPVSNTQRMCDALKAAESVNMELIEISCGSFDAILKFRIAFNPETETQA